MDNIFSNNTMKEYERSLTEGERSEATIARYMRDVRAAAVYFADGEITRASVVAYKEHLGTHYAATSVNSMLAAINGFFRFAGRHDLCVKQFRLQRRSFCSADRELGRDEYLRLVEISRRRRNDRLCLLLQTVCGTGIRVSELSSITVEAAVRGRASVSCKGKTRVIFIVSRLQKKLIRYAKVHRIATGPIFITRTGKPMDRTSIWREMKSLCKEAGVAPTKVFPHNLRHLFARTFYSMEKDLAKLADILGHTSINTTRIYIISTGEEHRRRMENMHLIL